MTVSKIPESPVMRIPFSRELNETFQSDRSVLLKMGGSAFVASLLVAITLIRDKDPKIASLSPITIAIATILVAIGGALLGLALSLKDTVQRRLERGAPVNFLLRLCFGMGIVSLLIWCVTIFFACILSIFIFL